VRRVQERPLSGEIGSIAGFAKMYFGAGGRQRDTVTVAIGDSVKASTEILRTAKEHASSAEPRKKIDLRAPQSN
jgi:hypothetical protein